MPRPARSSCPAVRDAASFRGRVVAAAVLGGLAGGAAVADDRGGDAAVVPAVASTRPADPAWALIRDEGLNRSKVAETAEYLCNVIGPRLTGSPAVRHANEWTRDALAAWGLTNTHLDPWGPFGRGWTLEQFSMRVTTPYVFEVHGEAKAWTTGLAAPLDAPVVYLDTRTEAGLAEYKDEVRGAIVLIGQPRQLDPDFEAKAVRQTDEKLAALAAAKPGGKQTAAELLRAAAAPATRALAPVPTTGPGANIADRPTTEPTTGPTTGATAAPTTRRRRTGPRLTGPAAELGAIAFSAKALKFAADHGAALVVTPSTTGDDGTVFVAQAALPDTTPRKSPAGATTQPRVWWPDSVATPPQVMITAEDFNRLASISRHDVPITAAAELKVRLTDDMPQQYDTIAEIPGTDLADQVVMVGGHLDSWQSGTGATDNAAGTVTAMEAVRLIQACGLHPRRTIRIGLWTGEEEGLLGSAAYVKKHFGTLSTDATPAPVTRPSTQTTTGAATQPDANAKLTVSNVTTTQPATKPATVVKAGDGGEYDRFGVYFNLDNGTGRIRGIYAQQSPAAAALFKQWLEPVADLGATTVTLSNTGSTDHISFDRVGLPGFQFIQDPIEYFPRTHHSNADTYDRLQIDDLKQASVVMATFLWDAANTPERFPPQAADAVSPAPSPVYQRERGPEATRRRGRLATSRRPPTSAPA